MQNQSQPVSLSLSYPWGSIEWDGGFTVVNKHHRTGVSIGKFSTREEANELAFKLNLEITELEMASIAANPPASSCEPHQPLGFWGRVRRILQWRS